jgi:hypothetical protein
MNKNILLLSFLIISFISRSQTEAIPLSDFLQTQVVLYVPTATSGQLNNLQTEFANQPQIDAAVFISPHNCLLINMGVVNNPRFIHYAELVKLISQYINYKEIYVKTPTAYNEIMNSPNTTSTTLK